MTRFRRVLTALAGSALVMLGTAVPSWADTEHYPAGGWSLYDTDIHAAVDWSDCDPAPTRTAASNSTIVDESTVDLTPWKTTAAPPHYGTSIETTDLGLAGDTVTVNYELQGADPTSTAIRLFIYDSAGADTDCTAPTQQVAVPNGGTTGSLQIAVSFDDPIGTLGLVYDSSNGGGDGGTVRFTDLKVDGKLVRFTPPPVEVTPEAAGVKQYDCPDENGNAGEVLVPDQEGVTYDATPGPRPAGAYEIEADPESGYVFPEAAQDVWVLTISPVDECEDSDSKDQNGDDTGNGDQDGQKDDDQNGDDGKSDEDSDANGKQGDDDKKGKVTEDDDTRPVASSLPSTGAGPNIGLIALVGGVILTLGAAALVLRRFTPSTIAGRFRR